MQDRFDPFNVAEGGPAEYRLGRIFDFEKISGVLRRQWLSFAILVVVGLILGAAYVLTAVPRYTASSNILINAGNKQLIDELSSVSALVGDETSILSQVELIKSDSIAADVVQRLGLATDPEFNADNSSPLGVIRHLVMGVFNYRDWQGGDSELPADLEQASFIARGQLQSALRVERMGRSSVLKISYTSASAKLASLIAQAFAEAYLDDQLNSKYEATRRASGWLQDRIEELKAKSLSTDLAVQRFKADHGLIGVNGQLLSEQQLSQLNTQLIASRGTTAEAEAKYQSIEAIVVGGDLDAIVSDALDDPVISSLRGKFLDASKREADIRARLGANHEQAIRLRDEMDEYRRLMFEELSRIAQSYLSALEIAKARQKTLEDQVATATGVTAVANDLLVGLRELEREAETYRSLYQSFLQNYQTAIQQQSFPVAEARVISRAEVPSRPSSPNGPVALVAGGTVGALFGIFFGAFREFRERYFRTGDQIKSELGMEFLGIIPVLADRSRKGGKTILAGPTAPARQIIKPRTLHNAVIDDPLSPFAETMKNVTVAVNLSHPHKPCRTIGIVSALQGEGKSIVAMNLALQLAAQGLSTLLIDGDMRNPSATRILAPNSTTGLADLLIEDRSPADVVFQDPQSGLKFIPGTPGRVIPYSSELLASPRMDGLLQEDTTLQYVVIDLPPLGSVADARAIASKVDAFVFVVEWGRTSRRAAKSVLLDRIVAERCVGAVLNKVDTKKLRLYEVDNAVGGYYYAGRYQNARLASLGGRQAQ